MRSMRSMLLATVAAAGVGFGSAAQAAPTTPERLTNADNEPQNWLMILGNYSGHHYSKLSQINKSNVANLRPVFMASIGGNATSTVAGSRGNEMAAPLVEDGMMFTVDSMGKIMKFDVRSGNRALPLWRFDPQIAKFKQYQNTGGIALWQNNVIQAARDARLFAINKESGEVAYEENAKEPSGGVNSDEMINTRELRGAVSTLRTAGGKDITVFGSGGAGVGWFAAHDTNTGKNVWRTYTIPQPGEPNFGTWPGDKWKWGAVMPWGPSSYDQETNTIYIGTGEPSPVYDPEFRPGDNLYSVSTLALDADTGKIKWFFQETPNDGWDFDSTGARILYDVVGPDGQSRKVVSNWARNGFFYQLDRGNGQFIRAVAETTDLNWTKGLDPKTGKPIEYQPAGGVQTYAVAGPRRGRAEKDAPRVCATWGGGPTGIWHPSYDPQTGITYQTRTTGCTFQTITKTTDEAFNATIREGLGSVVKQVQVDTMANIVGIDTKSGRIVASHVYNQGIPGTRQAEAGALATAGGLVFTGWADGTAAAFDKDTLAELWRFNTGTNLKGGFISYSVGGKQYIAHIAGGSQHTSGIADLIMPTAILVVYGL
jgi:alcohol dehydrogenase (cytochrome c)